MAKLPDIVTTGLRQEDLVGPNGELPPAFVETLVRTTNLGLRSLASAVTPGGGGGLTFSDNFKATVVTAKFTHGVATSLSIGSLPQCKGVLMLGADKGHVVIGQRLQGSSAPGQVKLTLWFMDSTAINISASAVLMTEGIISQAPTATASSSQYFSPSVALTGVNSAGALTIAAGGAVWTDLPNMSVSFTPRSSSRQTVITWTFSAFATGGGGVNQTRIIAGATTTVAWNFFWNVVAQHQSWTFQHITSTSQIGPVGTAATVKIQVQSPAASAAAFNQDANDTNSIMVREVG